METTEKTANLVNRLQGISALSTRSDIPGTVHGIISSMYAGLPLVSKRPVTKKDIVDATGESLGQLKAYADQLNELLLHATRANVEVRRTFKAKLSFERLQAQVMEELRPAVPRVAFTAPNILNWNTFAMKPEAMFQHLTEALWNASCDLGKLFADNLEKSGDRFFGTVQWHSEDPTVAIYSFRRHVIIHGQTDERQRTTIESSPEQREPIPRGHEKVVYTTTKTTTEQDYILIRRQGCHQHAIFDATVHELPAPDVRKPLWVAALIKNFRPWYARHLRLVSGHIGRETIVERDLRTTNWSERQEDTKTTRTVVQRLQYSPAICLGRIVLCGWSSRDL